MGVGTWSCWPGGTLALLKHSQQLQGRYPHVVIDDATPLVHRDRRAGAWFARGGVTIEQVMNEEL
jgi:hypothetical protein